LVVAHLRGQPLTEEIRDLREDDRARRRLWRGVVDLDAVAADCPAEGRALDEPGLLPQPGGRRRVEQREEPLLLAPVVRQVLDADQRRLRPPEVTPLLL